MPKKPRLETGPCNAASAVKCEDVGIPMTSHFNPMYSLGLPEGVASGWEESSEQGENGERED